MTPTDPNSAGTPAGLAEEVFAVKAQRRAWLANLPVEEKYRRFLHLQRMVAATRDAVGRPGAAPWPMDQDGTPSDRASPTIYLIVREEYRSLTAAAETALRNTGCPTHIHSRLPAELQGSPAVVVCHLRSTLDNSREIDGYIRFVQEYVRRRERQDMRLVVISPRLEDGPDRMVGWSGLVDALASEDLAADLLPGFIDRLLQPEESSGDGDAGGPPPATLTERDGLDRLGA